jgi:Ca-activated chloride channel family protein
MIVFLSDGLPTAGVTDEGEIADLVAQVNAAVSARFHVFGVGYDVNTHLLDRLAADSRGTVTYVRPGDSLETALTEFYGKVADPVLTDLEVDFEGVLVSDLYPQTLPDLFRGSSLMLVGLFQDSTESIMVRVRGWTGDERREYIYRFQMGELQNQAFVPRLWATRRVGALLDQLRTEGWRQSLEDEIRELGLGYGIVTPYTAFAIESQLAGAASAANMALYERVELNQASGRVTIDARIQNQAYQQAAQVSLANGANVVHQGRHTLAEIGGQHVDLSLLQGEKGLDGPITEEWLKHNFEPDRVVEFGSADYFALASDPEARPHLQSGRDVIFSYKGAVIAIRDQDPGSSRPGGRLPGPAAGSTTQLKAPSWAHILAEWTALPWFLRSLALLGVLWVLSWLLLAAAVFGYLARMREA